MNFNTIKGVKTISFMALFLIFAAGIMLVAYPLFMQQQEFATEVKASEENQAEVKARLDELKGYKQNIENVEALNAKVADRFPSSANTPELVNFVTEAAVNAGLSTSNITELTTGIPTLVASSANVATAPGSGEAAPTESEASAESDTSTEESAPAEGSEEAAAVPGEGNASNLAEISVTLSATGDADNLLEFIGNLNAGEDRNMLISEYAISTDPATGDASLTATGTTYIYRPIPEVSETTQNAPSTDGAAETPADTPTTAETP